MERILKLKLYSRHKRIKLKVPASLTIEAALVLPVFIYFILAFLYFIQILNLQEQIQAALTQTGLKISKMAYVYSDFKDAAEAEGFDETLLEEGLEVGLKELSDAVLDGALVKMLVKRNIDTDRINRGCILNGYDGIRFEASSILPDGKQIDMIARYKIRFPIFLFGLQDMDMIQRIRLRGWNGHSVPARYSIVEEGEDNDETMVYITETGSVYHFDRSCSHIKLSVEEVYGIPAWQRNQNGGKYYPCESCCKNPPPGTVKYYITSYGDRYHISKDCSGIKRTVREVPISEVQGRAPCSRCGR